MCARFALYASAADLMGAFGLASCADFAPRYNIAPTQETMVIRAECGNRHAELLRWGLVPGWAKEDRMGAKLINARGETIAEKPAFRAAFKSRRCIVPASNYYEWQDLEGGGKQAYCIRPAQAGSLFGFAGLWEQRQAEDGQRLETFTVVTTDANDSMGRLHDRMPVILAPGEYALWLSPDAPVELLRTLLRPCPADMLDAYPVSKRVGNVKNDSPACIAPAADTEPGETAD